MSVQPSNSIVLLVNGIRSERGIIVDLAQRILQIAEEKRYTEQNTQPGEIALALGELYDSLGTEEQTQFTEAVVNLLELRDLRVFEELCRLCGVLQIEDATSVLIELLRGNELAPVHRTQAAAALSRQGAAEASALLMRIVHERLTSPSPRKRRSPMTEAYLIVLAGGNPVAVAPYMRVLFEQEMRNGFKPWPAGPEYYSADATLPVLMMEIVSEFDADGVDLIKEMFRDTPAQWEAFLRVALSETVRRLLEPEPGGNSLPAVSEEAVQSLREYIESLSLNTNYFAPALPPIDYYSE